MTSLPRQTRILILTAQGSSWINIKRRDIAKDLLHQIISSSGIRRLKEPFEFRIYFSFIKPRGIYDSVYYAVPSMPQHSFILTP